MSFYGNRLRLRSPPLPKRELPTLERFERLTLQDLRKIKKFVEKYRASAAAVQAENVRIEAENKRRKAENERLSLSAQQRLERWEKESGWATTIGRMQQIRDCLLQIRVGAIGSAFKSTVRFDDSFDVPKDPGERFIKEYADLDRKADQIWRTRPEESYNRQPIHRLKKEPSPFAIMSISGARVRVGAQHIDLQEIERRISTLEAVSAREKETARELRARIAVKETQTRNLAKPYRSEISLQLRKLSCCPYCANALSPDAAHQDHIHPVCKGGQSVSRNLVFVCSRCNMKKRDITLGKFLRANGFSVSEVHARLEALEKDY